MNKACFKIREHLLDHHFGELEGLEKQRVEAHLEHCDECRAVVDRLGNAFTAAAEWNPEPKPEEIDRLVDRLAPYLDQPETDRRFGWMVGAGLALAAGIAMFAVIRTPSSAPRPLPKPAPLAVKETPPPPVEEVVRAKPTDHLRVVSSADWNGVVETSETVTRVEMDRGFAVMAFEGGHGRTLIVETPDVEVEVIGTRFYVDARPGVPTTIGVVAGKLKTKTKKHTETLEAGAERAYRSDGEKEDVLLARSRPYHSDAFLLEADPAPVIAAKPAKRKTKLLPRKKKTPEPKYTPAASTITPPPPPSFDPGETVIEAERYARDGDFVTALALIERALDTEEGKREPFQAMLRYTRARIMLRQGRRDEARIELGRLTHAPAREVSIQAQLSLCELELKDDPCTAAACLKTIDTRESQQLLSRWRLSDLDCD